MTGEVVRYVPGQGAPKQQPKRRPRQEVMRARLEDPDHACCQGLSQSLLSDEMFAQLEAAHQRFREEHPEAAALFESIQLDERVRARARAQMQRRLFDWRI
jgi:hypothetical protein